MLSLVCGRVSDAILESHCNRRERVVDWVLKSSEAGKAKQAAKKAGKSVADADGSVRIYSRGRTPNRVILHADKETSDSSSSDDEEYMDGKRGMHAHFSSQMSIMGKSVDSISSLHSNVLPMKPTV